MVRCMSYNNTGYVTRRVRRQHRRISSNAGPSFGTHSHGVNPVEFRGDLWRQKTRVPGLSCGVVCVILRLAALVDLRHVTDRQRDGHRHRQTQARG